MSALSGTPPPDIRQLPQIKDRMTFLYLEKCVLGRRDSAVTVTDRRGTVHVPACAISVLLLGPGTKVTHRAMELAGEVGMSILWVGESGVRFYAGGSSMTHSAALQLHQAECVCNTRKRLAVARKMYQMRFPDEDVSAMTMQQLRGREGARVRSIYRKASRESGVPWSGRAYDPNDFDNATPVNKALSVGNTCLYGLAHSVIAALGLSPALGFVHTGHERSFVYDLADLYKAETIIPLAFRIAAEVSDDVPGAMRRAVRDTLSDGQILRRMVKDVRWLLLDEEIPYESFDDNILYLWDEKLGQVSGGVSYGNSSEEDVSDDLLEIGSGVLEDGASP